MDKAAFPLSTVMLRVTGLLVVSLFMKPTLPRGPPIGAVDDELPNIEDLMEDNGCLVEAATNCFKDGKSVKND
jgi:hypothetical protein